MLRVKALFYFLYFQTTWVACGDVEELSADVLHTETDSDVLSVAVDHSLILSDTNDGSLLECNAAAALNMLQFGVNNALAKLKLDTAEQVCSPCHSTSTQVSDWALINVLLRAH